MSAAGNIDGAIVAAVEETFLHMAFLDVIATDKIDVSSGVSQLIIIDITRPQRGNVLLYLPLELKQKVVEIVHANQWSDLSSREIDDCLLEILNVLAGNFLIYLMGENIQSNMTFPQIVFDENDLPDYSDFKEYYFDAEGMVFKVSVRLES